MKNRGKNLPINLVFFLPGNAGLCRQIAQTSQMRDVEWATQTCTLTFATLGIWPEGADGTDINTCAKANQTELIATGDDFGKIKLFASPASQQKVCILLQGRTCSLL